MVTDFKLFCPLGFSKGKIFKLAYSKRNVFSIFLLVQAAFLIIADGLSLQVSWCKFEVTVESSKDIRISTSSKTGVEIPPVVVTAINLKTTINENQNINEIVSASIVSCHRVKVCLEWLLFNVWCSTII